MADEPDKEESGNIALGVGIGAVMGIAIGLALGNLAMGVALGAGMGVAFWASGLGKR